MPDDQNRPSRHPTDSQSLQRDTRVTFYTSSGPGGQHRNRSRTGVRLHHLPSGIVITATERRSQSRNLTIAFERLRKRLQEINQVRKTRKPTRPSRAARARRRQAKNHRTVKKRLRRKPDIDT